VTAPAAGIPDLLVIGLGGNVGSAPAIIARFGHARAALAGLGALGSLRSAPLYRSAPIGPAQPAYLNTAVRLVVPAGGELAEPARLLATLLELERLLGRDRTSEVRWGPRMIDLDILLWGARVIETPALVVPHPRLAERRFALAPVVALLGDGFVAPGLGPVGDLLAGVAAQDCEQLGAW
jgi:2-amino-4-hydroxy-6-hydroxymethyldihydropteridine diphosphokinase